MNQIIVKESGGVVPPGESWELEVSAVRQQVQKVQLLMKEVMHDGEHYGTIPGTNKPTLLKAGAEKLAFLFKLGTKYRYEKVWDRDHLSVDVVCELHHLPTGRYVGEGVGYASTKESKYAWRKGGLTCPECGCVGTVLKSKEGGYFCWAKKGGCGAKFHDNDSRIRDQPTGRLANPDLADSYNTIIKMGCKRALVAAILNVTAASDIFTQDMEDTEAPAVTAAAPPPQPVVGETLHAVADILGIRIDEMKTTSDAKLIEDLEAFPAGPLKDSLRKRYGDRRREITRHDDAPASRNPHDGG